MGQTQKVSLPQVLWQQFRKAPIRLTFSATSPFRFRPVRYRHLMRTTMKRGLWLEIQMQKATSHVANMH